GHRQRAAHGSRREHWGEVSGLPHFRLRVIDLRASADSSVRVTAAAARGGGHGHWNAGAVAASAATGYWGRCWAAAIVAGGSSAERTGLGRVRERAQHREKEGTEYEPSCESAHDWFPS